MEENMKVQYHEGLPMVDFSEFLSKTDNCDIRMSEIVEGARGNAFHDAGQSMCYDILWSYAIEFVSPALRHYNGWTKAWYVEEFLRRVGFTFEVILGQRRVCYGGKPLAA